MSAPCNKTFVPYFEVHADNENRYNQFRISYLKAVHLYVHDVKISILKGGTVQVTVAIPTSSIFSFDLSIFYLGKKPTLILLFVGEWNECKRANEPS